MSIDEIFMEELSIQFNSDAANFDRRLNQIKVTDLEKSAEKDSQMRRLL